MKPSLPYLTSSGAWRRQGSQRLRVCTTAIKVRAHPSLSTSTRHQSYLLSHTSSSSLSLFHLALLSSPFSPFSSLSPPFSPLFHPFPPSYSLLLPSTYLFLVSRPQGGCLTDSPTGSWTGGWRLRCTGPCASHGRQRSTALRPQNKMSIFCFQKDLLRGGCTALFHYTPTSSPLFSPLFFFVSFFVSLLSLFIYFLVFFSLFLLNLPCFPSVAPGLLWHCGTTLRTRGTWPYLRSPFYQYSKVRAYTVLCWCVLSKVRP